MGGWLPQEGVLTDRRCSGAEASMPVANLFDQLRERFGLRGTARVKKPLELPLGIDR